MAYFKLNTDGTLQSANTKIDDTWLSMSLLETKEDGTTYTKYLPDMVDGTYVPDLDAIALDEGERAIGEGNKEALLYLSDTDWMLMRELDGGTPMTAEVKDLRVQAREAIT